MEKLLLSILTITLAVSCLKPAHAPDPADAFVGSYTYTDNYYVRWGGDSKTDAMTGTFTLTKVSALEVQMHSPWNTLGRITANTITFTECPQNDSDGYVNYTFSVPVCPNCHYMLHRKPDGVFTPEELKMMLNHK